MNEKFEPVNRDREPEDVYEGAPVRGEETSIDWENGQMPAQGGEAQPVYNGEPAQPVYNQSAPGGAYPPGNQGAWGQYPPGQPIGRQYPQQPQAPVNGMYYQNGAYVQYPLPPVQPKKKMNVGFKVFLFVFSFLVVGTVGGLLVYLGYAGINGSRWAGGSSPDSWYGSPETDPGYNVDPDPYHDVPPHMQPDASPFPEASAQPEIVQPDIDIPKDVIGINLIDRPTGTELSPQQVYEKVLVSTVTVKAKIPTQNGAPADSVGSGIIITADGFMITNSHVVGSTKSAGVTVVTSDGAEYPAVVVGFDKATDLAVLKTEDGGFTPAEIGNSDQLSIGEWVMAIGNPGGSAFSGSLTRGVVSGLDRAVGYANEDTMTYIQTDAAINPGNSGGPLVNMYGQVVGINSSKIIADYYEGMGFAIPVSKAKDILDALLTDGYVPGRVRLGITGSNVTEQQAMFTGVPAGIQIISIDENSSFGGTNAAIGDIITAVDGEAVTNLNALSAKFLEYSPGDTADVTLYRPGSEGSQGAEFTVKVTLLEDKGETQK